MALFRCTDPRCDFEADVANAPAGADAMRCPLCQETAIRDDPARPAFKCAKCKYVFRASGSKNTAERCAKCGGNAPRV